MSDYLKITWGSNCTYADIYYNDGYADFMFIKADDTDIIEPLYEVVRKDSQEKEGRTMSPNKLSRKSYKVIFKASEATCDTINTIPLANSVFLQFPDGAVVAIKGDDVTVNIKEAVQDKYSGINYFDVELLFLTSVTVKKECCANLNIIPEILTPPTITDSTVTGSTTILQGLSTPDYFVRAVSKEYWDDVKTSFAPKSITAFSQLGAFLIGSNNNIYKTINGFQSLTLSYTPPGTMNKIKCFDANTVVAVGDNGVIAYTTDGGATWNVTLTGLFEKLYNLQFKSATKLAICGESGSLYLSNNSGATITKQTVAPHDTLYGLDFSLNGGFDKWIINGENGTYLRMSITDYTADNSPTNATYLAETYKGIAYYGTIAYGITSVGTIAKTVDYGANWTTFNIGNYTRFNDIGLSKYGILIVGVQDVMIDIGGGITDILDNNTTERNGVSCINATLNIEIASNNSIDIVRNYGTFVINGLSTATQFDNGELLVTYPTAGRTYITKVQSYVNTYVTGYSNEILVKIP